MNKMESTEQNLMLESKAILREGAIADIERLKRKMSFTSDSSVLSALEDVLKGAQENLVKLDSEISRIEETRE